MIKGVLAGVVGLGALGFTALQTQPQSDSSAGSASAAAADAGTSTQGTTAADAGASAGSEAPPSVRAPIYRDGGIVYIGDPPGRLTASTSAGGVANAGGAPNAGSAAIPDAGRAVAVADGGSPGSSTGGDEVQRLRQRVAALEQELARARAAAAAQQTQQADEVKQLNQQVATLREQLAQEQGKRQASPDAGPQANAQQQQAVTALSAAQQQLTAGDSRVMETLESAKDSLPAPAQRAVDSARTAVQSGDLSAARYWLSVAISQSQQAQINQR
ncbi:MAG TPA: hypothetical protein VG496_03145 [Myxococcales bacterium]|nr:hypothetical protein [Myxococcales bacterium]